MTLSNIGASRTPVGLYPPIFLTLVESGRMSENIQQEKEGSNYETILSLLTPVGKGVSKRRLLAKANAGGGGCG